MKRFLEIDGSQGEGGGQVLRTSLSLALITDTPVRVRNIRAARPKPGLMRQHLTAVRAAASISDSTLAGDEVGSSEVELVPGRTRAGDYRFVIGTAGSTTLVLQTVLLPLAIAGGTSKVAIGGGTHNPYSPPFDFLEQSFLPLLARLGLVVEPRLVRHGFHPAGGGEIEVKLGERGEGAPLELVERGPLCDRRARVVHAHLPETVAETESRALAAALGWDPERVQVDDASKSRGPGNALSISLDHGNVCNVFTAFGRPGLRARRVVNKAVRESRLFLGSRVPVAPYLADQLLIPVAVLGGRFRTSTPTRHTLTNLDVLRAFGFALELREISDGVWEVASPT